MVYRDDEIFGKFFLEKFYPSENVIDFNSGSCVGEGVSRMKSTRKAGKNRKRNHASAKLLFPIVCNQIKLFGVIMLPKSLD